MVRIQLRWILDLREAPAWFPGKAVGLGFLAAPFQVIRRRCPG